MFEKSHENFTHLHESYLNFHAYCAIKSNYFREFSAWNFLQSFIKSFRLKFLAFSPLYVWSKMARRLCWIRSPTSSLWWARKPASQNLSNGFKRIKRTRTLFTKESSLSIWLFTRPMIWTFAFTYSTNFNVLGSKSYLKVRPNE